MKPITFLLLLVLTGCASEGPTVAEQTAYMQAQIESTLIRMKCEAKCDMQMPMPGTKVSGLQQPTNGWDAARSLGNNVVQIVPWLATWGITSKGYDTIRDVVSYFPAGSTSNVNTTTNTSTSSVGDTTTTSQGDTVSTVGDTGSGNTTSGDVANTTGDTVDSSGSGNDSSTNETNTETTTTTTTYSNAYNTATDAGSCNGAGCLPPATP